MDRDAKPAPPRTTAAALGKGPPDCRPDLFGGRGVVRVWNLLTAPASPFTAVLSCELDPAASVGPHQQPDFPEIVIGLEGRGAATVNGVECELGPGDVVHLPLGAVLSISNLMGEAPLRYLIIKARG